MWTVLECVGVGVGVGFRRWTRSGGEHKHTYVMHTEIKRERENMLVFANMFFAGWFCGANKTRLRYIYVYAIRLILVGIVAHLAARKVSSRFLWPDRLYSYTYLLYYIWISALSSAEREEQKTVHHTLNISDHLSHETWIH